MDTNKLTLHQATIVKNLPGASKCMNSVFSAIVLNISIPFTRDDLHQLYDYDKALYKAAIEKNDNFSDDTKEKKRRNRSPAFRSGNAGHVFDAIRCLLSTYQLTLFGNHTEHNYRSGISKTIEGDNDELMEDNKTKSLLPSFTKYYR